MSTVMVTGATGNVGSCVVRELREQGLAVRAFVRDQDKAARVLPAGVAVAIGDFEEGASLRRALEGVDRVFLTSANGPREVEHECAVIDACAAAGVGRLVKLSTIGAQAGSPLPGLDWHGQIEEHLRKSGVPAVIVRSNFLMTNVLAAAGTIRQGQLFASCGVGRISMTDPRDVAACAAACLMTEGHEGRTYLLTGGEAITYGEVATALSTAMDRTVQFVDVPDEAMRQALIQEQLPDWLVTQLVGTFALARQGERAEITGCVRELCGREPRRFADFANDHAAVFAA